MCVFKSVCINIEPIINLFIRLSIYPFCTICHSICHHLFYHSFYVSFYHCIIPFQHFILFIILLFYHSISRSTVPILCYIILSVILAIISSIICSIDRSFSLSVCLAVCLSVSNMFICHPCSHPSPLILRVFSIPQKYKCRVCVCLCQTPAKIYSSQNPHN